MIYCYFENLFCFFFGLSPLLLRGFTLLMLAQFVLSFEPGFSHLRFFLVRGSQSVSCAL